MTNRFKVIRKVYSFLIYLLFSIYILLMIFFINGYMEKGAVNNIINNFTSRGVFEKQELINGQNINYYKVYKKYDYEDVTRKVFDTSIVNSEEMFIGSESDIILTNRNPLRYNAISIIKDIGAFGAREFYLGHATINVSDGSEMIECVTFEDITGVKKSKNDWIFNEIRYDNDAQTIISLRIKNTTDSIRKEISNNLHNLIGCEYNDFILFYNKNKYYCTDLISRTLNKSKIRINYDHFYTTGNDLIISDNTYVIFVCKRISDGNFNIYYLSEE